MGVLWEDDSRNMAALEGRREPLLSILPVGRVVVSGERLAALIMFVLFAPKKSGTPPPHFGPALLVDLSFLSVFLPVRASRNGLLPVSTHYTHLI